MTDDFKRAELRIHGRVQGVFFRASTREFARERGLSGWVKNLADGTVRAIIEGPTDQVEELVDWAHDGPSAARVEKVDVDWSEGTGEFDGFNVRR